MESFFITINPNPNHAINRLIERSIDSPIEQCSEPYIAVLKWAFFEFAVAKKGLRAA